MMIDSKQKIWEMPKLIVAQTEEICLSEESEKRFPNLEGDWKDYIYNLKT